MQNTLFLLLYCVVFSFNATYAQLPDALRRTAWDRAGIHQTPPIYNYMFFEGDTTGFQDNAPALQNILDTITQPLTILFGNGNYLFNTTLRLKSNTILKGVGVDKTHFIFDHNTTPEPSITIRGSQSGNYPILENANQNDKTILLSNTHAALLVAGDYFRLVKDDADLLQPGWPQTITGQVIKVDSIVSARIHFSSPLRMAYETTKNARVRKIEAAVFSGVECLKIIRKDYTNTGVGSSNIDMRFAANCHIRGVESEKCNFAHVEVYYSTNLQLEGNYFHDAHNWGSGGRGYGVMLQYATGEVLVQNNIFRRLRHAMILQAGANGNVFAYNYAYEGRKEIFPNIFVVGEDMVSHGNYPYFNLFEGNYAQYASVDNSHGQNGPFNTFFRNVATNGGFNVTNNQSHQQTFTANVRLSGNNSFVATNHHITDNSWQGSSGLNDTSLFLKQLPDFLDTEANWLIGPPAFAPDVSIPARKRVLAGKPISLPCDEIIWQNGLWVKNLPPSLYTKDFHLIIYPEANLLISENIHIRKLTLKPGADMQFAPGINVTVHQ